MKSCSNVSLGMGARRERGVRVRESINMCQETQASMSEKLSHREQLFNWRYASSRQRKYSFSLVKMAYCAFLAYYIKIQAKTILQKAFLSMKSRSDEKERENSKRVEGKREKNKSREPPLAGTNTWLDMAAST